MSLLLALLLGGPQLHAATFVNEDVTVNRTSGTIGGSVGIGTVTPGARLDIKAFTANSPPLLRLQQRSPGLVSFGGYDSPLLQLESEGFNYQNGNGSGIYYPLFTVTSGGYVGVGTQTPSAPLEIISTLAKNRPILNLATPQKRSFFIVPKLDSSGYNWNSNPGDVGMFFSDGAASGGQNATAGFVIAPWHGSWAGLRISPEGNVGIGTRLTSNPNNYRLAVNGKIGAKEILVENISAAWPDYVFEESYEPMALDQVEAFVQKQKHLPGIPSASEVQKNGLNLGEMNAALLKHIEELTLHVIEMKKENGALRTRVEALEQK